MLVREGVCVAAATLGAFFAIPAAAQLSYFDIPAQPLQTAIAAFGKQANVQIIAARAITKGKRSGAVRGQMTTRDALTQMLAGTGLAARSTGPQTFAIVATPSGSLSTSPPKAGGVRRLPKPNNGGATGPRRSATGPAIVTDDAVIVVTGYRESLASTAHQKRQAELIVDSVSAEDVGKFPDSNIAESLQRITGVAIDRSGGEGQFITVRGLGPEFNTVLVNGRMMATDNPGREFSFDVLSSTMIQRADVYKSSVASLPEGGIGATVNIVTARPLEAKSGFHVAAAAGGIHDDLRGKTSADVSAVASFSNLAKTTGLVLSASLTERQNQSDAVQIDGWLFSPQTAVNGNGQSAGLTDDDLVETIVPVHVPQNLNFAREQSRRQRINAAATFAAKLNDTVTFSLDGLYSKFEVFSDRSIFANFYSSPYIGLTVDGKRTATGFQRPGRRFLANNPALADHLSLSQNDNIVQSSDRLTQSYQIGANLKWKPAPDFEVRLDASKTRAIQHSPGSYVVVGSFAQTSPRFDLNKGSDLPIASNIGDAADPALLGAHYARIDENRVLDRGSEYRLDTEYSGDGVLQSVGVGLAVTQRSKVRRYFENADGVCAYCGYEIPLDPALLRPYRLDRFLTGASGSEAVPRAFLTFDPRAVVAYLSDPVNLTRPRQGRSAQQQADEAARLLALPGGPFGKRENLSGYSDVRERLVAGYLALQFGGGAWSGNAGVRVVRTATRSRGYDVPVTGVTVTPGDDTLQFAFGPAAGIVVRNSYVNVLPSANLKLKLRPDVIARAAFSQTLSRPTLTELGVGNTFGGRVSAPQSSGGNPGLKPFRSTNFDASIEWYLSRASYLSLGGFYKDLRDFLELQALPVERFGRTFLDTRTRNGQSGYIRGLELSGQYLFDWLPGPAAGLGVSGNYTYVESKAKRALGLSDYECDYNGLSPHSANGSVFYEKSGFSVRASYNWRSNYLRSCRSDQARPRNRSSYGQLDLNFSFDVRNDIQVYVQGINVADAHVHEWSADEDRFLMLQSTGARYNFGVRFKY